MTTLRQLRQQKTGLMQDLLTGKVRVKVDEAEEVLPLPDFHQPVLHPCVRTQPAIPMACASWRSPTGLASASSSIARITRRSSVEANSTRRVCMFWSARRSTASCRRSTLARAIPSRIG